MNFVLFFEHFIQSLYRISNAIAYMIVRITMTIWYACSNTN